VGPRAGLNSVVKRQNLLMKLNVVPTKISIDQAMPVSLGVYLFPSRL